jgi:gluconokinase
MLIVLFGLAGSGKNFVGRTLQQKFGFTFFDGDEVLPEEMKTCIREKKNFTQEMRNKFCAKIIAKITALQHANPNANNLVVSQGFYKEENREQVRTAFPNAIFIEISTLPEKILERLSTRQDWVNEDYAEKIKLNYETPKLKHHTIQNNTDGDAAVIKQLISLSVIPLVGGN